MFSKSCEYGIKAILYIATQSIEGYRVKIGDIAENSGSPEAFTAKIMGTLARHNIVNSLKGPYGGFEIDIHRMKQIKLNCFYCYCWSVLLPPSDNQDPIQAPKTG